MLRLDLEADNDGDMPTLEEFVAAAGLEDFTETEQLAHYNARYGDRLDRERRRTALVRRQLLAIHALEAHYARPVLPADGCEA
ncbi:hypothetical protein [Cupriavidus sp. CP313]